MLASQLRRRSLEEGETELGLCVFSGRIFLIWHLSKGITLKYYQVVDVNGEDLVSNRIPWWTNLRSIW